MSQVTGPRLAIFLPDLGGGGAERIAVYLANGLVQRGFPVDVVVIERRGPYLTDLLPAVRLVDLHSGRVMTSVLPLAKYLRRERPDVLFSHLDHANVGALAARRLARVPTRVVPTVHITQSQAAAHNRSFKTPFLGAAIKWCYPWSDAIVSVSHGTAEDMIRRTGIRRDLVRVIYNPVLSDEVFSKALAPVEHPWFAPGAPAVVLGLGRLTRQKNFPNLIRAFALLRKQRDCRLMILGTGEAQDALERLVSELGLGESVALPGFVANPYAYLARCAVFALSSAWEALPTVLIEALALSPRVVATDCLSGPREILDHGRYGRLVPVGDSTALAAAMGEALDGPPFQPPEEALRRFRVENALAQYVALISELTHA